MTRTRRHGGPSAARALRMRQAYRVARRGHRPVLARSRHRGGRSPTRRTARRYGAASRHEDGTHAKSHAGEGINLALARELKRTGCDRRGEVWAQRLSVPRHRRLQERSGAARAGHAACEGLIAAVVGMARRAQARGRDPVLGSSIGPDRRQTHGAPAHGTRGRSLPRDPAHGGGIHVPEHNSGARVLRATRGARGGPTSPARAMGCCCGDPRSDPVLPRAKASLSHGRQDWWMTASRCRSIAPSAREARCDVVLGRDDPRDAAGPEVLHRNISCDVLTSPWRPSTTTPSSIRAHTGPLVSVHECARNAGLGASRRPSQNRTVYLLAPVSA